MGRVKRVLLRDTGGATLVEVIVMIVLLAIAVTMIAVAGTNGLRMQATAERTAIAANAQADILAQARQVDYAELGFYDDQDGAATGIITLPLREDGGEQLRESAVSLGPTAPGILPFDVEPVQEFLDDPAKPRVAYRATTWITETALGDGTLSAKRVTVRTEWTPQANADALDGTCTDVQVRCSTQTIVRAATGSDVDSANRSAWESSQCRSAAVAGVCETYVRSGRVLDGSTMVSATDLPAQRDNVDLYARTSAVATSVIASWSYRVSTPAGGTTTLHRSVALESTDGGVRWTGLVEADADGASPRGDIRPGQVEVTFTATMAQDGSTRSVVTEAFWSVGLDSHGALSIDPASVTGTCTPTGGQVTFTVTGHSAGLRTTGSPTAGADTLEVIFPTTLGGVTESLTAPAQLVSVAPIVENFAGTLVEVATAATWQVSTPATSSCEVTRHASVQVHRAVDRTVTNIDLTLGT
ncbi:type IV pilus modification PilV family protein [Pseudactinotalea terrae]|uniref:type IV pilus modification PilV family protein n=1 Tax=Pseudactinotalea terrae TaxID=1743262 RepID=UPI0012E32727|nr:hypothetical protein [Pseudactinotalea terrae]